MRGAAVGTSYLARKARLLHAATEKLNAMAAGSQRVMPQCTHYGSHVGELNPDV